MIGAAKMSFKNNVTTPPVPTGSLFASGFNGNGECSQGGIAANYSSPVQIGALTSWTAVAGSQACGAGISGGKLFTWGDGEYGRTGHGDTTDYSSPVQVGAATDWTIISGGDGSGYMHGIRGGALFAWGRNNVGQLGVGDTTDRSSPTQVGAATDWTAVVGGRGISNHVIAIRGGALFTWGGNSYGQLGDGTTTDRSSPVQIGALTDWTAIGAGTNSSFGIRSGMLFSWGQGDNGRLGTNTGGRSSPSQVGAESDWTVVAGASANGHGIRGGALFGWGQNPTGEIGDGTTTERVSPVAIGAATDWTAIDGAGTCIIAIRGGALFTWGSNNIGQLGVGDTTDRSSPTQVGAATDWKAVAAQYNSGTGQGTSFAVR